MRCFVDPFAEEEFKERIAFIKCNDGALNVLNNDDGNFEEIQNAEQISQSSDLLTKGTLQVNKKKRIPFPSTGIKCKYYL